MFEQRIGRALVRIGIASRDYIDRLMSEVTQLDRLVARLQHSAACDDATPTALPGIKPAASSRSRSRRRSPRPRLLCTAWLVGLICLQLVSADQCLR